MTRRTGAAAIGLLLAAAATSALADEPKVAYRTGFDKPLGKEWSETVTDTTPKGRRRFLGQFTNDAVTLKLADLPRHSFVRLTFDLYIIRSWDGTPKAANHTPDVWSLTLDGRVPLARTTFSNASHDSTLNVQAWPGTYPGDSAPARTGAAETDSLGYTFAYSKGTKPSDAAYAMDFFFGHQDETMTLEFAGAGLQEASDESWGLDNVRVELLDKAPAPIREPKALADALDALKSEDPAKARGAMEALARCGDAAVVVLRKVLAPGAARPKLAELIERLDSNSYQQREEATDALKAMGQTAEQPLRVARERTESPEVRARIDEVVAAIRTAEGSDSPEQRRRRRALLLLRQINTPEARKALGELYGVERGEAASQPERPGKG